MNWSSARLLASVIVLTLGQPRVGMPQAPPPIAEVKSILREASALIPKIEASQRLTAAANIAAEQTRAGDDEGALASRTSAKAAGEALSVGGIAYSLAAQGRLPMALQLIAATADGQESAVAYWQVTQALLKAARFDDALLVARLISKDPKEADRFLDTLLQIYTAQWKAGAWQRASATLSEALSVAEREPEIRPGMSKPLPTIFVYSHRPAMFRRIVHTLVLVGNQDLARTVVARISVLSAQEQDPEKRKGILGPLATAQADVGDFRAALRTLKPIKSDFFGERFVTVIAIEQARQGNVADALATVAHMPQGFALEALQEMSRTLSDFANYAAARAVVDKMKGAGERASGLADLAFQQADKDPANAKRNVTLAWKLALEARDKAPSYVFQNTATVVAATRARLGDFAGALEIINGPDIKNKQWPLANLVQGMVGAGKKNAALALARSQDAPLVRADGLLQIARSLMDQSN